MRVVKTESLEAAISNIASHGDTDVAPYPIENHWFYDEPKEILNILEDFDENFDARIGSYPVEFVRSLSGVGYAGFRATTQIDPIWNAYLLALTIEIAKDIEAARVAQSQEVLFSYRFDLDSKSATLFARAPGWTEYQRAALGRAEKAEYVLSTDISDFYGRIYHHRLENALKLATKSQAVVGRIMVLLFKLSSGTSYGLPIGGNASRLLAELLLNRSDRLLLAHGVNFVRFVDDYYIFASSRQEAQSALVSLSEFLLIEGLTLSRTKTRLMTRAEFERSSPIAEATVAESETESEVRKFLKVRLAYDPYSATADDEYRTLVDELKQFDILGMLARELSKSRIDEMLVRQLVKSIRFLSPGVREQAIQTLLENLEVLYPIFSTVTILLKALLPELDEGTRTRIFLTIRKLLKDGSHITLVPINLAFAIRILAYDETEGETDSLLIKAYDRDDMMIKRDVLLAMARRRVAYWLSPALRRFSRASPWERRSLLAASYILTDEGKHWRKAVAEQLDLVESKFLSWVGTKNNGALWDIPL